MQSIKFSFLLAYLSLNFLCSESESADWPMWRHDIHRSASTSITVPQKLELAWSRKLKAPQPAWPASQHKIQFDAGYEPVCSDGKLLIGSNADNTLTAYDVSTGVQLWQFFADGPIRFAPAIDGKTAFVVSDDGFLYALELNTGKKIWKVHGGPSQKKIIGNDKLTSMWPARGGVVVEDGVAYFAAGIWPSMGVFIKAVDAQSGKVLWTNSTTGSRFVTHPHGANSFGSISPQGYLAISGDNLIVPGGRTLPGVFDKKTGDLKHFEFGGKGEGGYEVIASDQFYFLSGEMFRAEDGISLARQNADIVGEHSILSHSNTKIYATSIKGTLEERKSKDRRGNEATYASFEPEVTKEIPVIGPTKVHVQAGETVIAALSGRLAIYDFSSSQRPLEPVWSTDVEGDIWSVISANNSIMLTTKQGGLYCFRPVESLPDNQLPVAHAPENKTFLELSQERDEKETPSFISLLEKQQGYAISIGTPQMSTVSEILNNSKLQLVVAESNQQKLDAFQRQAILNQQYGSRVSSLHSNVFDRELPPYLASFVVSDTERRWSQGEVDAVYELLRPYGGIFCLATSQKQHDEIENHIESSHLYGVSIERKDSLTIIRRNGPLKNSGSWTHQYGDASSSGISADARVKTPLGLLWFGGPSNDKVLPRHGHGPTPQVAGGRLFIEGADMLRCVDVYTGRLWWEREFPGLGDYYNNTAHHPGAGEIGSNYVSLEDHLYVIYGDQLLQLNSMTGETTHEFNIPGKKVNAWGALRVEGDVLIAAASPVVVPGANSKSNTPASVEGVKIIAPNASWRFLAGNDPDENWAQLSFDDSTWKEGRAGFGYGDNDDKTVLSDMKGNYTRVYIRKEFEINEKTNLNQLEMHLNFDDAFIAYINGHEFKRVNVSKGSGKSASGISSHEAGDFESFSMKGFRKYLKMGRNVLAIEGHNTGKTSSDFSLDPFIVERTDSSSSNAVALNDALKSERFSSASRTLIAFDRHTGEHLWSRDASSNFRHNAICAGNNHLFCIDKLSSKKLDMLRRRGVQSTGDATLIALDLKTGEERWRQKQNVFGTFLNYSKEYDILLQGGSSYRDRAKDEVSSGLIAYQGSTGKVLWEDLKVNYGGPCLLHGRKIITNGGGGFEINLLTGKKTGWDYSRMY